ncbi:hypothetical protein DGo_PE0045 (plasmid) [Deinococcus gobiensis I-0]|uniref:Uncharacterized protein n=1 Tax=Deinococcus gobiensis (strain DSM 21396 / JCM 16679 / CGMCC 1.7299 / I-0) TaxID=745776 RepID=H8H3U2_DEIGI|nr:hypothetical protein DGo_PE0045 [Deinococcus gobiensis I-0]
MAWRLARADGACTWGDLYREPCLTVLVVGVASSAWGGVSDLLTPVFAHQDVSSDL